MAQKLVIMTNLSLEATLRVLNQMTKLKKLVLLLIRKEPEILQLSQLMNRISKILLPFIQKRRRKTIVKQVSDARIPKPTLKKMIERSIDLIIQFSSDWDSTTK